MLFQLALFQCESTIFLANLAVLRLPHLPECALLAEPRAVLAANAEKAGHLLLERQRAERAAHRRLVPMLCPPCLRQRALGAFWRAHARAPRAADAVALQPARGGGGGGSERT